MVGRDYSDMGKDLSMQPNKQDRCPQCGTVAPLKDSMFAGHLCRPCWTALGLHPERWTEP